MRPFPIRTLVHVSLSCLFMPLVACGEQEEDGAVSSISQLSEDRTATSGHSYVGFLNTKLDERTSETCTATLVSAELLLTAGHCLPVVPLSSRQTLTRSCYVTFFLGDGERITNHADEIFVVGTIPRGVSLQQSVDDIALVHLKEPVDGRVVPITLASTLALDDEGRMVGFSRGSKEEGAIDLTGVSVQFGQRRLTAWSGFVKPGDSGGPLLDASGRQIGVATQSGLGFSSWIAVPHYRASLFETARSFGWMPRTSRER